MMTQNFHRSFVFTSQLIPHERGHDLSIPGSLLAADHYPVTVQDGFIQHGVTPNFKEEYLAKANDAPWQRED